MTLKKEIEEKINKNSYRITGYKIPQRPLKDATNQICSLIKERLEKITDGYQITKTQAKVNDLIKELS